MTKSLMFNIAAAAVLDFAGYQKNNKNKTSCGTSFFVPVSNLVRMRSKMAALLPFN